jgi:hypothetical protein
MSLAEIRKLARFASMPEIKFLSVASLLSIVSFLKVLSSETDLAESKSMIGFIKEKGAEVFRKIGLQRLIYTV